MRRGYAVAWLAWEGDMLPGDGRMVLEWDASADYTFPDTPDTVVVHGGLVARLLLVLFLARQLTLVSLIAGGIVPFAAAILGGWLGERRQGT